MKIKKSLKKSSKKYRVEGKFVDINILPFILEGNRLSFFGWMLEMELLGLWYQIKSNENRKLSRRE